MLRPLSHSFNPKCTSLVAKLPCAASLFLQQFDENSLASNSSSRTQKSFAKTKTSGTAYNWAIWFGQSYKASFYLTLFSKTKIKNKDWVRLIIVVSHNLNFTVLVITRAISVSILCSVPNRFTGILILTANQEVVKSKSLPISSRIQVWD